jgi:hypothetical protein
VSQEHGDATKRDLSARIAAAIGDKSKFERDLDRWYEFADEARRDRVRDEGIDAEIDD